MKNYGKRLIKLISGVILYAAGIVITMKADLGYAPWDVFHQGLSDVLGLSFGLVSIVVSLAVALVAALLGEKLGIGTVFNMVLMGVFLDIFLWLDIIPTMQGWLSGLLMLFAGLFIIAFATWFYISAAFGAGPRDSMMVALKRKTGLPIGLSRGVLETTVVIIGWLLGGPVGVGTVLSAFGISFCIQLVFMLMRFNSTAIRHETLDMTYQKAKRLFAGGK
ncbi:MAG: hypothetical protein GX111_07710 [Clostridiales bacterium]|jgi:uncharacterized membrane protein YczE|nr:hypothetical protein [Clostridiales bacterium]